MRSSKLKKRLKVNDVIFPSTFMGRGVGKEEGEREEKKGEERYHRFISRSKSQLRKEDQHTRSISVNHRRYETTKSNDLTPNLSKIDGNRQRNQSTLKRMKRGCSSIEISKIYYDNLQKKLQQQCETILKQQHPKHNLKSYNLQKVTGNLMLLKQKTTKRIEKIESVKAIEKKSEPQDKGNSSKEIFLSQLSIMEKMNTYKKDVDTMKEEEKKEQSLIDISLSGNSIEGSEKNILADNFRHHNSLMVQLTNNHIAMPSQHSFFKSQVDSCIVQALTKHQIFFFSPKFSIKYTTYFKIRSLQIFMNEDKHYQFEIFFQVYNEIIFKRVFLKPSQERKGLEHRTRKGHMKKLQALRQKLKDRVLSYFHKEYDQQIVLQFYQQLILYLQNFLILQKSYRGLVLNQAEENILQLKNHDRIFQMLKINKSFHFILKLNYTFYLVKVIFSPQMEIKFTFVYDFTTHNSGDQICFSHPAHRKLKENRNQSQIYKIFLKVIQEFSENITAEWKCEQATNKEIEEKECSAKIGQITTCSIEKWDDVEVRKINNINKSYHLTGDLTNFFTFHDQFDFGFFNYPHHIFVNGQFSYSLDQIQKHVPVYVYPHTYVYLQLTQPQKEMLVIPHLSESIDQHYAKTYVNRFFQREISKNYKKQHEYFIVFINQQQIRMKQRDNLLDIYIQSLSNLRCYKLTTPVLSFPSYTDNQMERLDMKKASSSIQKFIKTYTIQKSFLYSKLIKTNESRLIIYYKGVQKLQGHFAFLTLYGLPLHHIVQFKIFMFRIGREFIIRFESIEWFAQVNLKQLIANLLQLIKTIYFKKLIQEQARKSKKRRMDSLENFLKKHGKSYVNQVRSKKKLDDQVKRRMMKLATLKQNKIGTLVYQNIITQQFKCPNGKEFLITLRYVPSEEFKEQNEWKNENIQICVHREGSLNHFRIVSSMRDLVQSVSQGKMTLQRIDFRQVHLFFKEVRNKIIDIIKTSYNSMSFIINRLRHFLIYNYQPAPTSISPFKYKLIHNIFYQTKTRVDNSDEITSQISIQCQMDRQILVNSNSNLIFLPYLCSQQRQPLSTHFSFICKKPVNHPYHLYIDQHYTIEIVDIFRNSEDYKFLKEYNISNREVWITDRQTGCRSVLSEWQIGFLSVISMGHFNRRLFKRLIKTLRPSL